ncbi:metabolite traffic protein EboE [Bowmanella dokdonensis]|uniref:Metabolite traffic protein EboE n=1 Tax=Bowmanella dokdonensis TaxID=751969 RepID=A0A939IPR1_9ALTE|nr:metabolite traffic protein EboE [Bowmanella dokdonensis]MBN7823817.1 metabolite traffic protein EboE [Bowmanella dokdonensis]
MRYHARQLGYCSNVHPGESLAGVTGNMRSYLAAVRRARGLDSMHCGLWLSAEAADTLQDHSAMGIFKQCLQDAKLQLTTVNGFPYGNFHRAPVKADVYLPDWSEDARRLYSLNLAAILSGCLESEYSTGTISTLPLGYASAWTPAKHRQALHQLVRLSEELATLEEQSGKRILLCLEMEPDCVLETTDDCLAFFTELKQQGARLRYLGICLDVCHQAVMFEDLYQSLTRLHQAGIEIGKIQLSNALRLPMSQPQSTAGLQRLGEFADSTYLHQCKGRPAEGGIRHWADLPAMLADKADLAKLEELRVHFHVPLFWQGSEDQSLLSTQSSLQQVMDFLSDTPQCRPHLEVETYSWQVLPGAIRPKDSSGLLAGISHELRWLEDQLSARHLLD